MRILILGGDGMLGHQLMKYLGARHDVKVTLRQEIATYNHLGLFNQKNSISCIDVRSYERLVDAFSDYCPNIVINAVGIVKQRPDSKESIPSLEINALLPHRLSILCKTIGARLIHLSTDCIFSGKKGNYLETDLSDAEDLYGKTKYLGEVHDSNCLTIRTSIIGRELSRHTSLLDWFLAQTSNIKGYRNAIYSGFTTIEMCKIIDKIILQFPNASGVYQVSSKPISKYELLLMLRKHFGRDIDIIPDDNFRCNRSLDSSRFRSEFAYVPPSWNEMVEEL